MFITMWGEEFRLPDIGITKWIKTTTLNEYEWIELKMELLKKMK